MARKVDDGFRGEQSAKAAKKRSKDFDFPEKQFGAGNKKSGKPTVKPKKGTGRTTMKTKGKGPAKTVAEAKRRGLSTFTDKSGKKKAAVTAEELKKSGLSLRDFLNKQQGKTRAGPKAPKNPLAGNKFLQASAKNVGKTATKPKPKAGSTPMTPKGVGKRDDFQPLGTGKRGTGGTGTPYMGFKAGGLKKKGMAAGGLKKKGMAAGGLKKKGMAAGGLRKKGMAAGGLRKKGMAMGGLRKKGMAMGGMRKKGFSAGKSVRGVGKATKGFRPVKMVVMSKGRKKGGKKRR